MKLPNKTFIGTTIIFATLIASAYTIIFAIVFAIVFPSSAYAIDMRNFDDLSTKMGFQKFYAAANSPQHPIKVAIFDNGFGGYDKLVGHSLPANTIFRPGAVKEDAPASSDHGIAMAELVTAFMTKNMKRADLAPQLFLFEVTGYTNLKNAIDQAIALKVDVILHAMVREYGSNYDGRGFFNTEVNRAIDAGIIWVNAAGNFNKTTYNMSGVPTDSDGWVTLPGPNQSVPVRCTPAAGAKTCPTRFVLSWNDFKDMPEIGTDKDLDLYLTDDTLNIVGASTLVQTTDTTSNRPGTSLYPREIIELDLKPGRYFLRVKNRSRNFGKNDTLRLTADSDSISFEFNDSKETILNPADNARAITVGASDSDRSSRSVKLGKPEISTLSYVQTGAGEGYLGSSNSAAIATAAAALTLANSEHALPREQLIHDLKTDFFSHLQSPSGGSGLTIGVLGFGPANGTCFESVTLPPQAPYISSILQHGGVFVRTTAGLRIMVPFDPTVLTGGLCRFRPDDMILTTPDGFLVSPRAQMSVIPNNWAEVFQTPQDAGICN